MTIDHSRRIEELAHEHIDLMAYDPSWPERFASEEARLRDALPMRHVVRIAHIGSTAVPGLSAKPVIDIQVEVSGANGLIDVVVPIMQGLGYEFIWRPSIGESAPYYAWFILRDGSGERSHHVHMVEPEPVSETRIIFRDFLRNHPADARRYEELKTALASRFANDRAAYAVAKTEFIKDCVERSRSTRP